VWTFCLLKLNRKKIDTPCTITLLSHNGTNCSAADQRRFDRLEKGAAAVTECLIIESNRPLTCMILVICVFRFEISISYFLDNTQHAE